MPYLNLLLNNVRRIGNAREAVILTGRIEMEKTEKDKSKGKK